MRYLIAITWVAAVGSAALVVPLRRRPARVVHLPRSAECAARTAPHRALRRRRAERARAAPTVGDCTAAVEQVARELRSGSSPTAALAAALGAHPTVLVEVRRRLDHGVSVGRAADDVTVDSPHERLVLQAVRVGQRAGGSGAGVFDRAGEVLREHQAWADERRSLTAQARLSARVLTALPVVFACWTVLADDGVRSAYVASPLPLLSTTTGALLNLVGWWWMRRLTRVAP